MVDVIVTVTGGGETAERNAHAVSRGGGLVGVDSTVTPPDGVEIGFVDWPFLKESRDVDDHLAAVRRHQPKYTVAPDVRGDRSLDEAVSIAEQLAVHARFVIMVPVAVPVDAIPSHFIVGAPFRNEQDTDTGVNSYIDFRGRPTHILGGNHTEQIKLADRFDLRATSADSPNLLAWAQGGRVWIAQLGGANEVRDIPDEYWEQEATFTQGLPTRDDLMVTDEQEARVDEIVADFPDQYEGDTHEERVESRLRELKRIATGRRIEFSVRNLVAAWNDSERRVTMPAAVEPGRGPHPVPPEGSGLLGPAETFEEREEMRERFEAATVDDEIGRVTTDRAIELFAAEAREEESSDEE